MTPLRQRMIADMQIRNLALRTQEVYAERVAEFARCHSRAPAELGIDHVRRLDAGTDLRIIQRLLGQRSIASTAI